MSKMRYDANMPSKTYDYADERALRASNIPSTLASSPAMRFDSEEDASVFFARELDYIKSKAYDKRYPEFTALQMFPVTHEVPEGAESFTYYGYERTGMAKIISNYATDLPRVDVKGEMKTGYVKSIGDSYGYNFPYGRQVPGQPSCGLRPLPHRPSYQLHHLGRRQGQQAGGRPVG